MQHIHPVGSAFTSDWSANSFTMVPNEKILVMLWIEILIEKIPKF